MGKAVEYNVAFDQKRAFTYLRDLSTKFTDRFAGSDNEKRAAQYIRNHFLDCRLENSFQYFPVTAYQEKRKKLIVTKPALGEMFCELVGLSANTRERGAEGEVIFIDTGEEEYVNKNLKGKILLLTGGIGYKKYEILMKVKPLAIIVIEAEIKKPPIRVEIMPEWREKYGAVPIMRISHEDGYRLLRKNAKRLRMIVRFTKKRVKSLNVIAELKGTEKPEEIVVIGGHYDTSPGIPGASDNAGGTALVMELARVFARKGSKRTLRFVAWGAEEIGLRGSIFYARTLKQKDKKAKKKQNFNKTGTRTDLEKHRLCVNLDVHGVLLGSNQSLVLGPQDLTASVRLLAKELGPAFAVTEGVYSSDGSALSEAGIPSVSFARGGGTTAYLHTPLDEISLLDAEALGMQGKFIETWLERYVTQAVSFPFERTIPDDQKKKIREYFTERLGLVLD